MPPPRDEAIIGCLLGMAVGDALGLWCEGMSPRRQRRLHPEVGYHFLFGRGMTSDDTDGGVAIRLAGCGGRVV